MFIIRIKNKKCMYGKQCVLSYTWVISLIGITLRILSPILPNLLLLTDGKEGTDFRGYL